MPSHRPGRAERAEPQPKPQGLGETSPNPRWALKQATDAEHQGIEARFEILDLMRATHQVVFLQAHAIAYKALRSIEAPLPGIGQDLERAITLLEADLAALDQAPVASDLTFPRQHCALGAYYVLIGSQFGKRVLRRRWRSGTARAFLCDEILVSHWPALVARLELLGRDPGAFRQAVDGARAAFGTFGKALEEALQQSESGRRP